ncbi:concanavalin A-like lectin/glucanase domain-containing protein, partial [Phyllosticta capitalensis]
CNPMDSKQYPCPLLNGIDNPSTLKSDFTAAKEIASPGWHLENDEEAPVRYSQSWVEGAVFTIGKRGDKPTIETDEYIWYGRVDVDMKVAVGQGIVSAVTIISDTKDEISWVTVGSDSHIARSNYVGKGNTATGERDKIHTVSFPGAQPAFHRYSIDWRHDRINWEINNQVMRTLMFEDTVTKNEFPQTPSKVRIGMWTLDDPDHQTRSAVELASGQTTYTTDGGMPWNMYVRRVEIVNYNASRHYNFTGRSRSADEV